MTVVVSMIPVLTDIKGCINTIYTTPEALSALHTNDTFIGDDQSI